MGKPLPQSFFARGAEIVALELLGQRLMRARNGRSAFYVINETEAYVGPEDLASHAARGRTQRTEVMFGAPGRFYVYLVYGMHWMLNVVTGAEGHPAAVLIRGVEGIEGPGRVTKSLGIDATLNGIPAVKRSGLWFAEGAEQPSPDQIRRTPRIGIDYAGPIWAAKDYRFLLRR